MLWHYTTGDLLRRITADRVVKLAEAGVPAGERPAVWFSANQDWEPTANKLVKTPTGTARGTRESTLRLGGGLARIGVSRSTAPHNWEAFKRLSGVSPKAAKGLYSAAIGCGARPGEWYVSFEPVPDRLWLAVERFNLDIQSWEPDAAIVAVGVLAN